MSNRYRYQVIEGAQPLGPPTSLRSAKYTLQTFRKVHPKAEIRRQVFIPPDQYRYWYWREGEWAFIADESPTEYDLKRWKESPP